jgi:phosphoglycerate dehydrogenase-like enzyme
VFQTEPLPEDSALWGLPNVMVSPHSADRTATFQVGASPAVTHAAHGGRQGQALQSLWVRPPHTFNRLLCLRYESGTQCQQVLRLSAG